MNGIAALSLFRVAIGAAHRGIGRACVRFAVHAGLIACLSSIAIDAEALQLLAVQSRKINPTIGNLDIPVDLTRAISGAVTTESRLAGAGNVLVFQFDTPVTQAGTTTVTDESGAVLVATNVVAGTGTAANEVSVTLPAVGDGRRLRVVLANVNGDPSSFAAAIGFLLADSNSDGKIDGADVQQVKSSSGQVSAPGNVRSDFNSNGRINAVDVVVAKSRHGNKLLVAYTVSGNISGLIGPALLQLNGAETLAMPGDGHFFFPNALANGSNFSVTTKLIPQTESCVITNGSGTIPGASVTNVDIQCAVTDVQTPSVLATYPPGMVPLGNTQPLIIYFSEGMDPASLVLTGSLVAVAPIAQWTTTASANDTLILLPAGKWPGGMDTLTISATDIARNPLAAPLPGYVFPVDSVFVSPAGQDSADGSPASPLRTIGAAMNKALVLAPYNVFLAGGTYNEWVPLPGFVTLAGGFDPATWQSNPALFPTTLIGKQDPRNGQYIGIEGLGGDMTLRDLIVFAPAPPPNAMCGGSPCSSYGVYAVGGLMLTMHNVVIHASNGASGPAGADAPPIAAAASGGAGGNAAPASLCSSTTFGSGGSSATNPSGLVQSGDSGGGGAGGAANIGCTLANLNFNPAPGVAGTDAARVGLATSAGRGGAAGAACAAGGDGNAGVPALNGPGGSGATTGSPVGGSGGTGTDGGGGGGGGGSGGCGPLGSGSSGAGGGGGGAGGKRGTTGGAGGTSGGDSYGIFTGASQLALDNVTVYVARGGDGGQGGASGGGQPGGSGGPGGLAAVGSPAGGKGGDGARGGHSGGGGGGAGGYTYGLYARFAPPPPVNSVIFIGGSASQGGPGGAGPCNAGQPGANGQVILNMHQ